MAKYNKRTVDLICLYLREGDTQKLACKKAGVGDTTFHEWMHDKSGFAERVRKAKDEFQATITGKLEATLWKRAMGYDAEEVQTEYVSDANGSPRIKSQKKKTKHIQPDTGALIFALTNVAPDRWVNRQKVETREIKDEEETHQYHFENLPDDVLFSLADKLQEGEYEEIKKERGDNE